MPGRYEKAWMLLTISGYMSTQSRSAKVSTVSRCMAARSLGMAATITRSAAFLANRLAASWLMA
ncbi:hypothetical protein D3C72_2421870 [compost metagenome]